MAAPVLFVYAICRPPRGGLALDGMAGEPLCVVRAGTVAAVAGWLPRAPMTSVATLRRYDAVQRALAAQLPAVLPARFGTRSDGTAELAFVLRGREASLRAALDAVRGRVQMTLRGRLLDAEETFPGADRSSGLAYLRSLASLSQAAGLAPVLAAVARWVRAERRGRSGRVASVYHLVPRAAVQAYVHAASRAAALGGGRVVVAGPFPPYAFGEAGA